VEFYFSDASLPTDKKLLKLIRKEGSQGFGGSLEGCLGSGGTD
jgi:hypothetical protein